MMWRFVLVDDSANVRVGKGTVFVKAEICKGCAYCIEFCPADCLRFSRNYNAKGYHYPVLARPELCVGCNTCGQFCPDFAIFGMRYKDIDALKAERDEPASRSGDDAQGGKS